MVVESAKPNRIGFGIASLIFGLTGLLVNLVTGFLGGGGIGLLLALGPKYGFLRWILDVPGFSASCSCCCPIWFLLGLVTGIVGLNTSKGRGLAIAGLVLSILALLIGLCAGASGIVIGPSPAPGAR